MSDSLEFTGERFTPECEREIWYEHFHRYALAARWCKGLHILDAACGEGYGSALLAETATSVEGVDISEQAVSHAKRRYADIENVNYQIADCTQLPFPDSQFDRVVSFETLEHLSEHDELMVEFRRVLKPDGFLVISSPDKATYSDAQKNDNEFHVKELYRDELELLIRKYFPASHLLGQKLMFHSAIWSMKYISDVNLDQVSGDGVKSPPNVTQVPMYYIALCAAAKENLPQIDGKFWLFDDVDESVYQHYHGEIKRNMAAGGIIANLESEIEALKKHMEEKQKDRSKWWQRILGKN